MPDFKKYITLAATPEEVYAALTFEPTVELWTGSPATIIPEVDKEFSMWDGSIVGKFVALEPAKMIQQQWYFGDGEPSIVTLKMHEDKRGTSLEIRHTDIPAADYDEIVDGWNDIYLKDLQDFYAE
ncbi:MAG: activator of HSP90 ATPase [Cyclobacteriaceae bacterium]|jgi:activator of HSP90 ATPase